MNVTLCTSDAEIAACWPVMAQLRPHIPSEQFIPRVRLQQKEGYQLAAVRDDSGNITAVAGFRIATFLAWGKILYIDDLVTDQTRRSSGHGHALLQWLLDHAKRNGCEQLHLDSGVQRFDAHRFYLRERMAITAHHFEMKIPKQKPTE